MTRASRFIFALFAALLALAAVPAQGQSNATVSFTDPNCSSWAMTQNGSTFTLTCQTLSCSIAADKPNPQPTDTVNLTATCLGAVGAVTYTWSQYSGPGTCPQSASTTNTFGPLSTGGASVSNCVYKVAAKDTVNSGGVATVSLTWSSGPPPAPTGCVASIVTNPATMTNAGGTATVSVNGCQPAGVTYNWSKNGAAGWSASATPPPDTLAAGGTAGYTNSYQVNVCNGSTCINVPSPNPLTAVVPGSGGGGSFDFSACTAAGYTGRGLDIAYPVSVNVVVPFAAQQAATPNGTFGNTDALVIRFTTPAQGVNDGSRFQPTAYAPNQGVSRLYTISTKPCEFSTVNYANGSIAYATAGSDPGANVIIGNCPYTATLCPVFGAYLKPSTTYYITMVNRTNFVPNGIGSCSAGNCDMRVEFNQ